MKTIGYGSPLYLQKSASLRRYCPGQVVRVRIGHEDVRDSISAISSPGFNILFAFHYMPDLEICQLFFKKNQGSSVTQDKDIEFRLGFQRLK